MFLFFLPLVAASSFTDYISSFIWASTTTTTTTTTTTLMPVLEARTKPRATKKVVAENRFVNYHRQDIVYGHAEDKWRENLDFDPLQQIPEDDFEDDFFGEIRRLTRGDPLWLNDVVRRETERGVMFDGDELVPIYEEHDAFHHRPHPDFDPHGHHMPGRGIPQEHQYRHHDGGHQTDDEFWQNYHDETQQHRY